MLFFTRFVFDLIVEQTNLYYMQVNAAKPSPMIWFDMCGRDAGIFWCHYCHGSSGAHARI